MMPNAVKILFIFLLFASEVSAQISSAPEKLPDTLIPGIGSSASGVMGSALARADVALTKSVINPAHLRGEVGESFMGKVYLESILSRGGNWELVSPRLGRQGIDGILMKFDKQGAPREIIVVEAKYGNSILSKTKVDGWQLSDRWTIKRMSALAKRYVEISQLNNPSSVKQPVKGQIARHKVEINLRDGEKGVFWRINAKDSWKYDGPGGTFRTAQQKAGRIGSFLDKTSQAAAKGNITYRSRLVNLKLEENTLRVAIGDASKMSNGKVPMTDTFDINLSDTRKGVYTRAVQGEIAQQIRKKLPHISQEEALSHAKSITGDATIQEMVESSRKSLARSIISSTGKSTAIGAVIFGGIEGTRQLITEGRIDFAEWGEQVTLGGTSAGMGALGGQGTVIMLTRSPSAYNSMLKLSSLLNLQSTSFVSNLAGSLVGGSIASFIFAYGGALTGQYDLDAANRIAATGIVATSSFLAAETATMTLAMTYGTASTGAAISSLTGAAAHNSALAFLGGGATSAGGTGIAGGTLVLGSVATVAMIGVTAATMYGFYLYDSYQDDERNRLMREYLLQDDSFLTKIIDKEFSRRYALIY